MTSDELASEEERRPVPSGDLTEELHALRVESARLRYELSRLRDRRTVRLALAIGALSSDGPGRAWDALRGRAPRQDVPGPRVVPRRAPFPHLRAVTTGRGELLAGACARTRITPRTGVPVVARDRPDLLLVDEVVGWREGELTELTAAVRAHGGSVVTVGTAAGDAVPTADLHVLRTAAGAHRTGGCADDRPDGPAGGGPGGPAGSDDGEPGILRVPGVVDLSVANPVGLEPLPAHRRDDAGAITLAEARHQPVVVVAEPAAVGIDRCLALLAAGAVLVAGHDRTLAAALVGLDATTSDLVLGPPGQEPTDLATRAATLLGDDELRHRVSVRLRRHVQRHCSTRLALERIVVALDRDRPPSRRISVLLATRRPDRVGQVLADLTAQHHDDLEVVLLPHGDAPLPEAVAAPGLRVQRVPAERPLGAVLDVGLELVTGAYVAKVDDDDRYGSDHLADLVGALEVSGAAIVGRRSHGVYLEDQDRTIRPGPGSEERYENHLPGGTLLLPADTLRATRWRHVPNAVDTELIRSIHLAGGAAYSSHRYGYVRVRHGDHTWAAQDGWDGPASAGFDHTLLEA